VIQYSEVVARCVVGFAKPQAARETCVRGRCYERVGVDGRFFGCRSVAHWAARFINFFWPLICYNLVRLGWNYDLNLATYGRGMRR
jgi:hypothetical protein